MAEIPTPTTGYSAPSGERPLGVTIIAVLNILGGLLSIFGGFTSLTLGLALGPFGFLLIILGAIILFLGIINLIIGWGLWSLKSWAWMAALIINIINLILNVLAYSWLSAIINLIVILYLQQGDIKSRFR
jgi:uncharacterized membrane protein (DUF2068 family)